MVEAQTPSEPDDTLHEAQRQMARAGSALENILKDLQRLSKRHNLVIHFHEHGGGDKTDLATSWASSLATVRWVLLSSGLARDEEKASELSSLAEPSLKWRSGSKVDDDSGDTAHLVEIDAIIQRLDDGIPELHQRIDGIKSSLERPVKF